MKTWIDLLGYDTDSARVDGCDIVRGVDQCERLWTFDTPEQAKASFEAWLNEVRNQPPAGSWASVAFLMAKDDDSGFDWDEWKDEMKER